MEKNAINDNVNGNEEMLEFNDKANPYGIMKGLVNYYSGQGFTKEVKIDPGNLNFF